MRASSSTLFFLIVAASLLGGCAEPEEVKLLDRSFSYAEEDDAGNGEPNSYEDVNAPWSEEAAAQGDLDLTISGSASSCDFDTDEQWPWTGDNDYYRVEIPAAGYLEVILDWEQAADFDLLVALNHSGNTFAPRYQISSNGTEGPEVALIEELLERGDDLIIVAACAGGQTGDYTIRVLWED